MNKNHFNDMSMPLISSSHAYFIEPAYPQGGRPMSIPGKLKNDIAAWVLKETGCSPEIGFTRSDTDGTGEREVIHIHCTPDFIKKLDAAFHDRIEQITRIATRDEITAKDGPDICWKDPGL